jgi:hypothetical protein
MDGLPLAVKRAKQWRDDAVLWYCENRLSRVRENGTCERWDYTFISPSTIQYNVSSPWSGWSGFDWCEVNYIQVYANRTVTNYSQWKTYPPFTSEIDSPITDWNFDTDQAFSYIIKTDLIYSYLQNVSAIHNEVGINTNYSFQTSIWSENNQTYIHIMLSISNYNFSDKPYYWKFNADTGSLSESNFNKPAP